MKKMFIEKNDTKYSSGQTFQQLRAEEGNKVVSDHFL